MLSPQIDYFDKMFIDWKNRQFVCDDKRTSFSHSELLILEHLINNAGVVVTKTKLLKLIKTNSHDGKVRDIYMCKIRSALGEIFGFNNTPIKSVWGRGTYFKKPGQKDISNIPDIPDELNIRNVIRWTKYLKLTIFYKVKNGEIDKDDLFLRNSITEEEFSEWGDLTKAEY